MRWLLGKLGSLGADVKTLTTHDAVHGEDEKWSKQRYESSGFGYGPPGSLGPGAHMSGGQPPPPSRSTPFWKAPHPRTRTRALTP